MKQQNNEDKRYTFILKKTTAVPRRNRAGNTAASASVVRIESHPGDGTLAPDSPNRGDGHTHANKSDLDKLSIVDDYINITDIQELEDGTVQQQTRRAKAGYADEAAHALSTHDIDSDSPVYERFVRKDVDDTVKGRLTMERGALFGPDGSGGHVDENGDAEFQSLRLHRFLEVPELRYNRCTVEIGNKWLAPGGGIIEKCVPDSDSAGNVLPSGTIYLKLEEGERGTVEVNDLCQGIFHDSVSPKNNANSDEDDGKGNFRFAGFYTVYFKVTEILDKNMNGSFRYTLRELSPGWGQQLHPCEMMHFVAYGNTLNTDRQTSRYSTKTYERYLRGVNQWEFTREMICSQFGVLDNLQVFGLQMDGYSAYLDKIYMSGTIQQFEEAGYALNLTASGDEFFEENEVKTVQAVITDGYGRDVSTDFKLVTLKRNTGNVETDREWNKAYSAAHRQGIPNPFTLSYEDMGFADGARSTTFTLTAQDIESGALLTNE